MSGNEIASVSPEPRKSSKEAVKEPASGYGDDSDDDNELP